MQYVQHGRTLIIIDLWYILKVGLGETTGYRFPVRGFILNSCQLNVVKCSTQNFIKIK